MVYGALSGSYYVMVPTIVGSVLSSTQLGFMFYLQQLACIFSIVAAFSDNDEIEDASQVLNCLAEAVYLSDKSKNEPTAALAMAGSKRQSLLSRDNEPATRRISHGLL
ncbi:hypothetical protein ACFE04_023590 [Oxalis oulophora]